MKSLLFFQTSDRGWPACGRLGRQTSARIKTSARLKITFVDMTSQGLDREPPSLSPHFLLSHDNPMHIQLSQRCRVSRKGLLLFKLPFGCLWLIWRLSMAFDHSHFQQFPRSSVLMPLAIVLFARWLLLPVPLLKYSGWQAVCFKYDRILINVFLHSIFKTL